MPRQVQWVGEEKSYISNQFEEMELVVEDNFINEEGVGGCH